MDDPVWDVAFISEPIRVHARDGVQAREVAIEYLRQPETKRIIVTAAKPKQESEK